MVKKYHQYKRKMNNNLKSLNIKTIRIYDVGNPVMGQALKYGGIKPVNGIPTFPLLIIVSSTSKHKWISVRKKIGNYISKDGEVNLSY